MPPSMTHDDALDEELSQHVGAARADRHADADLARPLGHRHEHDVHDADAADEQRDRGNRREQARHHLGRAAHRLGDLRLVAHGEIVVCRWRRDDAASRMIDVTLILRRRHLFRGVGADEDLSDAHVAAQTILRRGVRHQHDVVLVLTAGVLSFRRQHADDRERHVADLHLCADGILIRERDSSPPSRRCTATLRPLVASASVKNSPLTHGPVANREVVGRHAVDRSSASCPAAR